MSPLRLLLASHDYPPFPLGGTSVRVAQLAPALAARGHQVTVFGMPPRNRGVIRDQVEDAGGVRVVRIAAPARKLPHRLQLTWDRWIFRRRLAQERRRRAVDLVEITDGHGWLPWGIGRGAHFTVRLEATDVLYDRVLNKVPDRRVHRFEHQQLMAAGSITALSAWVAGELPVDFPEVKVVPEVIHNAVEDEVFTPGDPGEVDPHLVTFVNGIEPRKGVRELLQSFNLWGAKDARRRLLLIGADNYSLPDGRRFAEVCMAEVRPELRSRIEFAGRKDRVTGIVPALRRTALAVYPSHIETFGIAPVEAMSCGRPVIYSRTGPGEEIIRDGHDGLLVDPLDPSAIARAIEDLLGDRSRAEAMGAEARRTVLRRFALKPWVERNEAFYSRAIRGGGAHP